MPLPLDFDGNGPPIRYAKRYGKWQANGVDRSSIKRRNVGVIDFETDRFDNLSRSEVHPFLVIVYSDQFPTITIWDDDWHSLIDKLYAELSAIPEPFTFYAHNGGRFDFMFLMHLITGALKFKGRSMLKANFAHHELRDSLHIIPEGLKNANRKIEIDYTRMDKDKRDKHRQEIITYCLEDCVSLFEMVRGFIDRFGMPMTIGQAAMTELRKHYPQLKKPEYKLNDATDRYFRPYFFGGRVEVIGNAGHFDGPYKVYDVNSMYLSVMCETAHPISAEFLVNDRITKRTAFIHLRCQNRGAFVARGIDGELDSTQKLGQFWTTIHEYRTAKELGLVQNISIIKTVDFLEWSDFSRFGLPLYAGRQKKLAQLQLTPDDRALRQSATFDKYVGNNAYGKFAQNPRRFKDHFITEPGDHPPPEWLYYGAELEARRTDLSRFDTDFERVQHSNRLQAFTEDEKKVYWQNRTDLIKRERSLPTEEAQNYHVWTRPSLNWRFNNVATAASITGAARAKLMRAKHFAVDARYCDTDSLICRELRDHPLSNVELGAWKLEATVAELIVAGKKLYGYRTVDDKEKIRAKGMQGVTWDDLLATLRGEVIAKTMIAPTISKLQTQQYMTRLLKRTA